ncbi:MAG: DUF2231 domain-containing protein [Natronospirillum sp.]|uniref:DUF2231 domain-containing protein n=1 Tax=Natronospirillum sp. TaxID=2812955 RepID=UPI0025D87664|nr:DUF2231 domain-containing protein [Natronospirillum sp.]MCH8553345.1 DUF2231 domain-containing protein [Natronospirillum sp.]
MATHPQPGDHERALKLVTNPITSRMAIHGHPLHPILIHFPVAALLGLVATDVAWLWTGDSFWARAGLWLAGVGALGGWVSGFAGLVDLTTVRRVRRLVTAWCHAIMAVMLLSLASLNWLLRVGDPVSVIWPWGLYLSLLTGGLIAITGFLGGKMVYEFGVGVDTRQAVDKHHPGGT